MGIRNVFTAALLSAAATFVACGPSRQTQDAGFDAGPQGCVGVGCGPDASIDAGSGDGGTKSDGGSLYDGGLLTVTLEDLRGSQIPFGANVKVEDVVVHTVSYENEGNAGAWRADFWVSDPANPPYGIWVSKFYTDLPNDYRPSPGDKITIEGYFRTLRQFENPTGYRRVIQNNFRGPEAMTITVTGTVTPPAPITVQAGAFGNADGGSARPDPEHAGSQVFIEGPVEIVNPSPEAFHRVSANPNDPVYYGFEITGGILVNNSKTFRADGGCPWRDIALDAGVNGEKVVFTGGVSGVWDTYTFAACADGGTDIYNCFNDPGKVPGTNNNYTYVLYPQSCADFVGGEVQPQ